MNELVWCLRHGGIDAPADYCIGHSDLPLSAQGQRVVERVARRWQGLRPERIVHSDLNRSLQTAQILAHQWGVPMVDDARLRELDTGRWEGQTWEVIRQRWPDELARWSRDWLTNAAPGGESGQALIARVSGWWQDQQGAVAGSLIIAHTSPLRALLGLQTSRPVDQVFAVDIGHAAPFALPCG